MFGLKRNLKKGFTLIEMLVVLTIFSILTGVVLVGQSKFNSSILLTNLAYDTALTVRQAQNYGINIKEFTTSTTPGSFVPYGVHFEKDEPNSFIFFADLNEVGGDNYGIYTADASECDLNAGCVNKYNIKNGNYISALCLNTENEEDEDACDLDSIDVTFVRPNPDAVIRVNDDPEIIPGYVTVILKSADETGTRKIKIQSNGLIQIINN